MTDSNEVDNITEPKTKDEIDDLAGSFTQRGDDTVISDIAIQFKPKMAPVQERLEEFVMSKEFMDEKENPSIPLKIQLLPHFEGLNELKRSTLHSSGIDLQAAVNFDETLLLNSIGASVKVPTGIMMEIPVGYEVQIRPRSGLSAKHGIIVTNTPGTVDADYRGEIFVLLTKLTTGKFRVNRGDRIAQMVLTPVVYPKIVYVDELSETVRGAGGFGHTGT